MRQARLIQDFRDRNYRPIRRSIADGLARLEQESGTKLDIGRCYLHVPRQPSNTALFATLRYRSEAGDIDIAYPFSKGCRARTASGESINLSLDQLAGAIIHEDAKVLLADGRSVHALEFDPFPHPKDFTDLEHAIVFLTVRFLNEEDIGFRYIPETGYLWLDYSRMSELSVSNVKALARYIDAHIGNLPRRDEDPPLGPVSLAKIHNTLAMAGIRKVRGRKPKKAA
jgi:hypothetical protein